MAKETIFWKGLKQQTIHFESDMPKGVKEEKEGVVKGYDFTGGVQFKSSLRTDASVILAASYDGKERESLDFLLSRDDCESLVKYLSGLIGYIDERNEVIGNLLDEFATVHQYYKDELLVSLNVEITDYNPMSHPTLEKAPLLLKFTPEFKPGVYANSHDFSAVIYVTGIMGTDFTGVWSQVLPKGFPLKYGPKLVARGEKKMKALQDESLKKMDERMQKK